MRIYISVDLEGITGVVGSHQVPQSPGALPEVRKLVTADVRAAVDGAREGGASEIWINENHSGRDLLLEEFDEDVQLLLGKPKPLQTLEGLDGSFHGVFLVGSHARAGTAQAVLDHTWTTKCVQGLRVNGLEVGEVGLNALLAGHHGVPIALVSGDLAVSEEARRLLGDVECAVVKYALDRYSARCLPPARSQQVIREAALRAMKRLSDFAPLRLKAPLTLEIDYADTAFASRACWIPTAQRVGPRCVAFQVPDFLVGMKTFLAAAALPTTVRDAIY